jgi:phospholipase DDHD1
MASKVNQSEISINLLTLGTGSQEHILPKHLCKNLYNIFHPSDPIAYRVEPLIIKHYTNKSPLEIQKSDVAPKISYKELNEKRTAFNLSNEAGYANKNSKSSRNKKDKELEESVSYRESSGISLQGNSPTIEQVELERALDFQLQDSNFELMATLRAHTCYWKSSDTALFILSQLILNDSEDCGDSG